MPKLMKNDQHRKRVRKRKTLRSPPLPVQGLPNLPQFSRIEQTAVNEYRIEISVIDRVSFDTMRESGSPWIGQVKMKLPLNRLAIHNGIIRDAGDRDGLLHEPLKEGCIGVRNVSDFA